MTRYIFAALFSGVMLFPPSICADDDHHRNRYYDSGRRDYHEWNDREERAYRHYLKEQRREYRKWQKVNRKQQREYWRWRHEHPGDFDDRR